MRRFLWAGLLMVLCAAVAVAQTTTGSIYGTVKTADGLVIQDVKITLSAASSRVDIVMEASAAEEIITITGETAVVDLKKTGTATNLSQDYLANIPSARDPWVILDQVAGLMTDRVNVGGSESGQQSNFVSKGDNGNNVMWNVDGVIITDMASMSSPGYYDFDSFEEMQVTPSTARAASTIPARACRARTSPQTSKPWVTRATRSTASRTTASMWAARSGRATSGSGAPTACRTSPC